MLNISDLHAQAVSSSHQPHQNNPIATPSLSRDQWQQLNAKWEKSSLSQKAFCKSHNINFNSFSYFRSQLKQKQPSKHKIATIKVVNNNQTTKTDEKNFILLLASGAKLVVPTHYNQSSLKSLLTLLGVC